MELITSILSLAAIPAIMEELLIRGAIFSLYEKRGTITAVVLSSVGFAMLHTTPDTLLSSLAVGLLYGMMVYITGSIWSGVIAHFVNNVYSIVVTILAANYTFHLYWDYFAAGNIIVFFGLAYLAFRELEGHSKDGAVPHIAYGKNSIHKSISGAITNTGFILFGGFIYPPIDINFTVGLIK